jgi:hypothetical protein
MIVGDTSDWDDFFQQELIPSVLSFIIETWELMPSPGPSDHEDKISDKLYSALLNAKRRNDYPFLISREDLEFDTDLCKATGRKDIVFYPSLQKQEIYLCLEAKRLNVIGRSLADEYVKNGMQRFVDRKYSRAVRHGAMLAYVLDGDIGSAMQKVEHNIRKKNSELRMGEDCGLTTSSIRPNDASIKETRHRRESETTVFRIHHLFVTGKHNN